MKLIRPEARDPRSIRFPREGSCRQFTEIGFPLRFPPQLAPSKFHPIKGAVPRTDLRCLSISHRQGRTTAVRSPVPAIDRRTRGDRRSTGKMAWESQEEFHVRRETMSRPPPRPPPEDDTLALASSLTYAAPRRGSHPAKTLGRDMAPAPCDRRRRDRRAGHCCWQGASRRCLRLSASGASVPRARRTPGNFQFDGRSK